MTLLVALVSFGIGLQLGYNYRLLLGKLHEIYSQREPVKTGVVRPEVSPAAQLKNTAGVVRPKAPKEVAAENERAFNEKYGI